ncbi:Dabb family protein [Limoniibacter endophyticus]|uniref:Stress responsive protein n=1 Tax=Limoniibacter endophyticus TaxID=1565040 RepID=A0A8J3GG42_9HYPH|nr:Dabb family protein [Limoniibacter endophyticus]GHC62880.1 stress responsive protein [Limoniibacter endophyticus]
MIRHIVLFTVKPGEDREQVRSELARLGTIPHSQFFEVVLNSKVDLYSNEVDIVVYGEFADEAALAAFKADPIYHETTALVRPRREVRMSADYRTTKE